MLSTVFLGLTVLGVQFGACGLGRQGLRVHGVLV